LRFLFRVRYGEGSSNAGMGKGVVVLVWGRE